MQSLRVILAGQRVMPPAGFELAPPPPETGRPRDRWTPSGGLPGLSVRLLRSGQCPPPRAPRHPRPASDQVQHREKWCLALEMLQPPSVGPARHRRRAHPVDVPAPLGTTRRPPQAFFASVVVLPCSFQAATIWGEIQAHARLRGRPGRSTTPGSPPAASPANFRSPRSTSRTTPTSPSTRASNSSTEDSRRGMSRGTNHSTQEATRDTGREQKAQVGRRKASAITRSTGLRRRERRFESCRGHHPLTCSYYSKRLNKCPVWRPRGMSPGTNSSHIRSTSISARLDSLPAAGQPARSHSSEVVPHWHPAGIRGELTASAGRCSSDTWVYRSILGQNARHPKYTLGPPTTAALLPPRWSGLALAGGRQ